MNTGWIYSVDWQHPEKPGKKSYEHVPCLVVYRGQAMIRQWNCEHLVWDTEDGDDFFCKAEEVDYWMPIPPIPVKE